MARAHNFSAGPAALPVSVLAEIRDELLEYGDTGMSVMEMSHRSAAYRAIIDDAEATLRRLLAIPDAYRVLFLQGGATLQFAGIPMNLMRTGRAGYVVSGNFAKKAWQEAQRYGTAELLATSADTGFDRIPDLAPVTERARAGELDYVYTVSYTHLNRAVHQRIIGRRGIRDRAARGADHVAVCVAAQIEAVSPRRLDAHDLALFLKQAEVAVDGAAAHARIRSGHVAVDILGTRMVVAPAHGLQNEAALPGVPASVSYTHLDVYKRQIVFPPVVDLELPCVAPVDGRRRARIRAVRPSRPCGKGAYE